MIKGHGNINNKIIINNKKNNLTIYKNFRRNDWFYRFHREKFFYNYCKKKKINLVPLLLGFNNKKKYLKIQFIETSKNKINKIKYINQTINFIKEINFNFSEKKYKFYARENLAQKSLYKRLNDRLLSMENKISKNKFNLYKKTIEGLKFEKIDYGKVILNPSDVGKHNLLLSRNRLFYIDFEYSGTDKLIKFVIDFVMHPSNEFNFKKYTYYANFLLKKISPDYGEINNKIFSYFAIWWCLRLQKNICKKEINFKIENNLLKKKDVNSYIAKRKKLIDHYEYVARYYKD